MKINANTYVCQLSEEKQDILKVLVTKHFTKEGYSNKEIEEILESVFENRLWNVEEVVDIKQFF
jgi:uncharacterized membrane-anchored protein